jgi:hypothetical protein
VSSIIFRFVDWQAAASDSPDFVLEEKRNAAVRGKALGVKHCEGPDEKAAIRAGFEWAWWQVVGVFEVARPRPRGAERWRARCGPRRGDSDADARE